MAGSLAILSVQTIPSPLNKGLEDQPCYFGIGHYGSVESQKPLELFRQGQAFNVALLDIAMPGMDGMTLLEKIKAIRPATEWVMEFLGPVCDKFFVINSPMGQINGNSKVYTLNFSDITPTPPDPYFMGSQAITANY